MFEAAGENRRVAARSRVGDQYVDDVADLVDGPVPIHPRSSDLGGRRVDDPTIACGVPAGRAASISNGMNLCTHRIHRDMIDLDAPFSQQLVDVAVRQPIPEIPADATMITSGGNRNPAHADRAERSGHGRRDISSLCRAHHPSAQQTR